MTALTGQNTGQIRVAIQGHVYVAPTGTTGPTNVSGALDAAFQDLGYTDETGVVIKKAETWNDINVWQATVPARKVPKSRSTDFVFVLEQMNSVSLPLWGGGGSVSVGTPSTEYAYTVSTTLTAYERSLVIDGIDGSTTYRFYIPRGMVTATTDLNLSRDKEMQLGLTFTALAPTDGTSNFFYIYTNDANQTS